MKKKKILLKLFILLSLLFLTADVYAQSQTNDEHYTPEPYQSGKDVVWLPTETKLAAKMLDLAKVTPDDYVIDLGSGDGRIVIAAAKRGAKALGIEYNPDLVALSKRNAIKEGVADKAEFIEADIFESDFSKATVIIMFLLPELNLKLRPIILNMKPGVRVVSNSFDMFDWIADERITITKEEGCDDFFCEAFFWVVPAKVGGLWQMGQNELILEQRYQILNGKIKSGKKITSISDGFLNGDEITFICGEDRYIGRVQGNTIGGIIERGGKNLKWHAMRVVDIPEGHQLK